MGEGIELPERSEHGQNQLTIPVAVTMSILAVLVATATLLGHRAATEEIVRQARASDQWAYYQSKNIRRHEMETALDLVSSLVPGDKVKADALVAKYKKELERYENDKEDIGEKAQDFEKERDLAGRKEDRYDTAEVILEIGLIICSLTLLTNMKAFWYSGIGLGIVGGLVAVSAAFIR